MLETPIVTITKTNKGNKIETRYKGQSISRTTKNDYKYLVIAIGYSGKLIEFGYTSQLERARVTLNKCEKLSNAKEWTDLQIVEIK